MTLFTQFLFYETLTTDRTSRIIVNQASFFFTYKNVDLVYKLLEARLKSFTRPFISVLICYINVSTEHLHIGAYCWKQKSFQSN